MNQILSVDPNNNKNSNKASLRTILIVFSVILMIFGLVVAGTGVYSYLKNTLDNKDDSGLEISTNTKPVISVEREDATNIKIIVTHDKELESVTYTINDSETEEIKTNGKTEVSKSISLPSGTTNIKIIAEDVNGLSSSREDTFEVGKQVIKLEKVEGEIKATVEIEDGIDYIMYYWDEDMENAKKFTINNTKTETQIEVIEGTHTLNVVAVGTDGKETKKSQVIKGVKKPNLDVKTNGKVFKIDASDESGLSKIEIKLNSNETKTETIEGNEYTTMIDLEDGVNKLIVTVYNKNGVSKTSKVKYTKE